MSSSDNLPSDDELAALLHRLRPFILQRERFNFLVICNLLCKKFSHPYANQIIKTQKEIFLGKTFENVIGMQTDSRKINCESTLQLWLNAEEFHREQDKQASIDDIKLFLPASFLNSIFYSMLIDKVRAINAIQVFIKGLERRSGTRLTFESQSYAASTVST